MIKKSFFVNFDYHDKTNRVYWGICPARHESAIPEIQVILKEVDLDNYICPECEKLQIQTSVSPPLKESTNSATFSPLNLKFVKKYMRLAKLVGEDQNPCYSRQIGTVLVDPIQNKERGFGYNGPPKHTPHCDEKEYLEEVVWPQLTTDDKFKLSLHLSPIADLKQSFLDKYSGCKQCPRRLIGAKSGERSNLCSCLHSERNAITNASCDLHGAWAFCWCGVPCDQCTGALINAGIKKVFCLKVFPDYSLSSRFLFKKAGVDIFEEEEKFYLE